MARFKQIDVEERPYLYVDKQTGMDPAEIGPAMGEAFQAVYGFIQREGITSVEGALSVYYTYDPDKMAFRAGFMVSKEDAAKASGEIMADVTPAGRVVHFTHKGSYSTLRDSYGKMMAYIEKQGLKTGAPAWEVYLNGPQDTAEADLLTEVYCKLA